MNDAPAYALWPLVVINSLVFIVFAFSFTRPRTARDWRSLSGFSAFIVALFTEMYGFPLTIYLLSGWVRKSSPLGCCSHDPEATARAVVQRGSGDTHVGTGMPCRAARAL